MRLGPAGGLGAQWMRPEIPLRVHVQFAQFEGVRHVGGRAVEKERGKEIRVVRIV